jgi:nucleotide-binding universal stress UspA family protein
MKILCAVEFDDAAPAVVEVASRLASWSAGALDLLHVIRPQVSTEYAALAADADSVHRELREGAKARLAAIARSVAGNVRSVSSELLDGDPSEAIVERARRSGADVVVMGSRARSALARGVFGSTAVQVVRRAPVPVLIVPVGAHEWGRAAGTSPMSVVAAVDGRETSASVMAVLRRLRANIACDVDVVRLYWPPEELRRLGLQGQRDMTVPDRDVVEDLERGLRRMLGVLPGAGETKLSVLPAWGDPAGEILSVAQQKRCDLLIVGAESRHGLERALHPAVAERLARRAAEVPVLFVPPSAPARTNDVPSVFTVLAATDLSALGNRAVPFAYTLLGRGGIVELCYVHERPLPSPPYAYESRDGALNDERREEIEARLRSLVPKDAEALGITTHINIVDGGHAGEAIVAAAERLHADSITLGSHGRSGVARALVGSVADTVMRHARRPVLVVPQLPN